MFLADLCVRYFLCMVIRTLLLYNIRIRINYFVVLFVCVQACVQRVPTFRITTACFSCALLNLVSRKLNPLAVKAVKLSFKLTHSSIARGGNNIQYSCCSGVKRSNHLLVANAYSLFVGIKSFCSWLYSVAPGQD